MEKGKTFDVKKFASNNAIIILIVLLAILTGCTTENFFTTTNFGNLVVNVAPHYCLWCVRLSDYQGNRPVCRPRGRPGGMSFRYDAAEPGLFRADAALDAGSSLAGGIGYRYDHHGSFWCSERRCDFYAEGSALYCNPGYADGYLRSLFSDYQ